MEYGVICKFRVNELSASSLCLRTFCSNEESPGLLHLFPADHTRPQRGLPFTKFITTALLPDLSAPVAHCCMHARHCNGIDSLFLAHFTTQVHLKVFGCASVRSSTLQIDCARSIRECTLIVERICIRMSYHLHICIRVVDPSMRVWLRLVVWRVKRID